MDLYLIIYLIGVLGSMEVVFAIFFVGTIIALVFGGMAWLIASDKSNGNKVYLPGITRFLKKALIAFIILSAVGIFVPSQKTAYMMTAAYAVQKVATSDKAQVLSDKTFNLLVKKLDDLAKEEK